MEKSSILCEGVVFIVYFGAIRLCEPVVGIACERRMAALSVGAEWPLASNPARHYTTVARSGVTESRHSSSLQASSWEMLTASCREPSYEYAIVMVCVERTREARRFEERACWGVLVAYVLSQ
jgi:hypothetical protein